ncbi:restriction endonuclease subunit S [Salinispora arenicola]|uniref:restriction endonuclease subunit S n=1 Tax=Salinispora arenicola TaxID=168697 RepID=UPI0012BB6134|nr:restriction endonuclease subunit S [Salinispora arenicola]
MTPLPTGWRWATLGEIADVAGGVTKDSKLQSRPDLVEVPYLRVANVQRGRIDLFNVATIRVPPQRAAQLELQPGDVLLNEGGDRDKLGRGWVWQGQIPGCIHQNHVFRARIRDGSLHPKLLAWYANEVAHKWFELNGKQSVNLASISLSKIRTFPVPIPPAQEQQRIVDILEEHLSRLGAAEGLVSTGRRKLLALRRSILRAVIHPDNRRTVPLRQLVERIEAGKSFGGAAGPAAPEQWGIIKVSAMTWGEFRPEENKAVPAAAVNPQYEIRAGDLLVSRANTSDYVGASVLVGQVRPRLLLSDKSLRVVPRDNVHPCWLWFALSSPGCRSQISAKATGTKDSMRNISQASLLSVEVPHVPPAEQAVDVAKLTTHFDAIKGLADSLEGAVRRQRALKGALLDAAFSGRLTGRGSDMDMVEEMAGV